MPRGSKTCPKCKQNTGPRALVCKCGHSFTTAKIVTKSDIEAGIAPPKVEVEKIRHLVKFPNNFKTTFFQPNRPIQVILIPAGDCPIRIDTISDSDIFDWVDRVRQFGLDRNMYFHDDAIIYYFRQFYNCFTEEYEYFKLILKDYKGSLEKEVLV